MSQDLKVPSITNASPADLIEIEPRPSNPSDATSEKWSLVRRIAFRFACAYLLLFLLPNPLRDLAGNDGRFTKSYDDLWMVTVPWVGKHLLGLEITVFPGGSSDTTFNYVHVLCCLILAVMSSLVWSLLDVRRPHYAKAHDALRIYLRYMLGTALLFYGMAKVFKTQFPFPDAEKLLRSYGESSPMGLLWSFMGYSTGYNIMTGAMEIACGLLLFSRRTTTLGALGAAAVMANVVTLNFCYDVPVKIFSTHLLLVALFLLLPDMRRLINLFVLNRPTEPVVLREPFQSRWMERGRVVVKVLFIGGTLLSTTQLYWDRSHRYGGLAPKHPFSGVYEIETFIRNEEMVPPLLTEDRRWRALAVNRVGLLTIRWMNDTVEGFRAEFEPEEQILTLRPLGGGAEQIVLGYAQPAPDYLVLQGTFRSEALTVRLRRIDDSKFLLVNRGFNWIIESPLLR